MANFALIRELSEERGMTLRKVAGLIGMTEGSLQKIMAAGSTNTTTLEKIARALNVQAGIFFEGYIPSANQSIANGNASAASVYGNATAGGITDKDKEIKHLKELLKEKERLIQILINK